MDAETGDILDLDKQVGTRSVEFLSRPLPCVRNIITKYWWYRDQPSIAQKSNEREFVWSTKSTKYVTAPEDSELPCKWEDVARITIYDNNGNVLRDLFYPSSYKSEFLCRFLDGTGSGPPKIIKTRVMYFVPPEPEGEGWRRD